MNYELNPRICIIIKLLKRGLFRSKHPSSETMPAVTELGPQHGLELPLLLHLHVKVNIFFVR